jgi:hypothetical protein
MGKRLHVKLRGGLGNQLHIFIASWVVGKSIGKGLRLDGRYISWSGSNPDRRMEIHKFCLPSVNEIKTHSLVSFPSISRIPKLRLAILTLVDAINSKKSATRHPGDSWVNLDHILEFCNDEGSVEGHFLDLRWVQRAYEMGFPDFLVLSRRSEVDLFFEASQEKQCAIHVRLTDYLNYSHIFVQLSEEYYLNAVMLFRQKGYREFILFSDDVEALKVHFPRLAKSANLKIVPSHLSTTESFYHMHRCSAIITANSTFSTLAAMFIWRRGGDVVSPNKRNVELPSEDYWVPAEWIVLDSHSGTAVK